MNSAVPAPYARLADSPRESQLEVTTGPAARLLLTAIRAYQLARIGRVSPCRFTPTCNEYALEAVRRHGAWRGLGLTIRRLGRCRPGGPSGYDPVPEHPSCE